MVMFEGLGAYGFFNYSFLTQRRKESSGLGKNPDQTVNRNCVHF